MADTPPKAVVVLGAVWLLWLSYTVLAPQNVLAGVLPGLAVIVAYYAWRLLMAVETVADGIHRLADAHEAAVDAD